MSLLSGVEWSGVPSCCVFVTPSHPVNQIESHPRESLSPLVILLQCLSRLYLYNDQTWRWIVFKISLSLLSRGFQGAGPDARDWQIRRGPDNCSLAWREMIISAF